MDDNKKKKRNLPKFNVTYCNDPSSEVLKHERYIEFIKHLVKVFKEREELLKK